MRELSTQEVALVAGSGFFKDLGQAVGEAHNALDTAIGDAFSTGFAWMKNEMYQRDN